MGLLSKKDNELNAGKALEDMMDKFDIDLNELTDDADKDNSEISKRRREKGEREKLGF